jgi:hypothetical protein
MCPVSDIEFSRRLGDPIAALDVEALKATLKRFR